VSCLFHLSLSLSLFCLCCPSFASLCFLVFAQECKKESVGDFDESLFFLIPLPLCAHLNGCLVHFPQLGFIGPLFRILSNFALIGLIFVSNYF